MDADDMCKIRGLLKRPDGYYFQARVPEDCRKEIGKSLIREKLKATTCAEAKALVSLKWVEVQRQFRQARIGLKLVDPTDADIAVWSDAWIALRLEEDEEVRIEGLDDRGYRIIQESLDISNAGGREELARGDTGRTEFEMDDFLDWKFGVRLAPSTQGYRKAAYAFLRATVKATELLLARHRGEIVETPKAQPKAASSAPLLSEVVAYFLEHYSDKSREMYRKHRIALPLFMEIIGDKPVDMIKRMDIESFCRLICRLPPQWRAIARKENIGVRAVAAMDHSTTFSPKTFEDTYLACLRAFLNRSRLTFGDRGFPTHLTTEGIIYSGKGKAGQRKQRAMTPDELTCLMKALIPFAKDKREVHKFWLPMLALHSGARINELCQINPQCDYGFEDGIPYLHITDEGEHHEKLERKSVKNETSRRKIPIHPKLVSAGFINYVEAVKASGEKLLFPQWQPQRGVASSAATDWFEEFLRTTGLRDDTPGKRVVGFHAFRSTFLNRADTLRVRDADILTGHAGEKTAIVRGYQGELGVKQKLEILEKVTFDLKWPR